MVDYIMSSLGYSASESNEHTTYTKQNKNTQTSIKITHQLSTSLDIILGITYMFCYVLGTFITLSVLYGTTKIADLNILELAPITIFLLANTILLRKLIKCISASIEVKTTKKE